MSDLPDLQESMVLVQQEGAVRTLTLNRPAALNAFTGAMLVELREALERAAAEPQVRAVVITGAGRGFCAGQDLSDPIEDIGAHLDAHYTPLMLQVRAMPVPVIAAVNGVAAGAGANFALGCDLVLAAESANFIQAFSKIGLLPDCGGTWLLPRLLGRAKALELALLGDKLGAREALSLGMIARCVPDAELAAAAQALAQRLATLPTRALAQTRRAFDEALTLDFEDAVRLESVLQSELGAAADFREGVAAFMEKRKPVFSDR